MIIGIDQSHNIPMDGIIWYEFEKEFEFDFTKIESSNLKILKIEKQNFESFSEQIKNSIDKFNSEIYWDKMWDLEIAQKRFLNNNTLFLLLKFNSVIGHVWYSEGYLYNAFVSKERETGESKWFIEHTMLDRFNSGFVKISLYTEFFNTRAINFWRKLVFEEKKNLIISVFYTPLNDLKLDIHPKLIHILLDYFQISNVVCIF